MNARWMIDFDGVLADLSGAMVASCNAHFSTNYTTAEIDSWSWWRSQPKKYADYVWKTCYSDPDWTRDKVAPMPGAIDALHDLLTADDEFAETVMVVTARKAQDTIHAQHWLEQHLLAPLSVQIISSHPYRKSQFCEVHRLGVVVDDHIGNLRHMNAVTQRLFLVDTPGNQGDILTRITRVKDLAAAVAIMAAE